ncbi:MAG TPA: acyl-CoA dehydratase activase [Deltaproteobacteria bacterium]|nr:acyl-CoA dehydratase activase [Deltaproteobacteria bacterium]HOI08111.1 acyl-CoA dehydratase activase [Deltaproteobacteria bacterium]
MSYLGIDIGSSYLKVWHEGERGNRIESACFHHRGSPREALIRYLSSSPLPDALCYTGSLQGMTLTTWHEDGLLGEIHYLREIYPMRKLLILGAEKIELVHFDDAGRILSFLTNPACAAGTGSFLDEQMGRLGLSFSDLERIPINEGAPMVATRCAVFAKTDLIHLQQEGYSAEDLYNGLCKGLVMTGLKSVFGGSIPDGSGVLLTGGLLANPHIRHYLKAVLPKATVADDPIFSRARGMCRRARLGNHSLDGFMSSLKRQDPVLRGGSGPAPLGLKKSSFPSYSMKRTLDGEGNEVWHDIGHGEELDAYLGVDVGSTSTKAVLVDGRTGSIRLDIYTKTSGNPIEATRRIFRSITELKARLNFRENIRGCCTTGSGRKLIGVIIGADLVINEISAHAKGAQSLDPSVETIFEIGGQDAKFIRLDQGRIVDVNMNYVCAAGTGSFIEEQAGTLGMSLDDMGEAVMGVSPLPNSDRCTVFMNQEITRQLAAGFPKEAIMAGVLHAVFKNYLGRVVGNRAYSSETIVFQGATARNKGLVAALEGITGAEVKVSPFCHVMGAYGAALLVRERGIASSSFRGFTIPQVRMGESVCKRCENSCRITTVKDGTRTVSWGYLCGREQGEKGKARRENPAMRLRHELLQGYRAGRRKEGRTLHVPALALYDEFLPLLGEISRELGVPIEVSTPSREELQRELATLGSGDFCYPIKVAMASAGVLLRTCGDDPVLMPFLIQDHKDEAILPRSLYCPFVTSTPSLFLHGPHGGRVFAPVLDLNEKPSRLARRLLGTFEEAGFTGLSRPKAVRAVRSGLEHLARYRQALTDRGAALLEDLPADRPVIVLFGRPYNLYHKILNLGIPELVESLGYTVVPMDIIPDEADNTDVIAQFPDLYWLFGQKILRKALTIRNRPNLFPLVLSNFSCGPDSFILSYFEEISRSKPYLILELDEHGSATGYGTRIEAFCDMIEQYRAGKQETEARPSSRVRHRLEDLKGSRLWIPQIHPYTPQLWSAVLNRYGFAASPTGEETPSDCILGRSYCRGSECLPAAVTIGRFLTRLSEKSDEDGSDILIMPRAEGPCRFGQYATMQSRILERTGHASSMILSPTSENGYSFLSPRMELEVWSALCLGDLFYKLRCRTLPYHPRPDQAAGLIDEVVEEVCRLVLTGHSWENTVRGLVMELDRTMDHRRPRKPLVGVVGEIFVRLNTFSNGHLIDAIEEAGGEAWLAPMSEWIHYVWTAVTRKSGPVNALGVTLKRTYLHWVERRIHALFSPLLDDRGEPPISEVIRKGRMFIPVEFEGEAILTIGRARIFADQGASLIVNCSPFGCMPGRITSYLFQMHPGLFKVPVVNLFFDGIGDVSSQVAMYLKSITQAGAPTFRFPRGKGALSGTTAYEGRSGPGEALAPGERNPV